MKKFIAWMGMMACAVLPSMTYGLSALIEDDTFDYYNGGGGPFASIHSWVTYDDDVDTYTYNYQIQGVTENYMVNYFQLSLPDIPVSEITNISQDYTGPYGQNYAAFNWSPLAPDTQNPIAYGMGAFYTIPISEGLTSYILRFDSLVEPGITDGLLSGFDGSNHNISLTGSIYTPVPEPMTLLFLAAGGVFALKMK